MPQQVCYFAYQHDYYRIIKPSHLWQRKAERYVRGKGFVPVQAEEILYHARLISRAEFQQAIIAR